MGLLKGWIQLLSPSGICMHQLTSQHSLVMLQWMLDLDTMSEEREVNIPVS